MSQHQLLYLALTIPQSALLVTIILVGGLLLLKGMLGKRAYKRSIVDMLETVLYFNLLSFVTLASMISK